MKVKKLYIKILGDDQIKLLEKRIAILNTGYDYIDGVGQFTERVINFK